MLTSEMRAYAGFFVLHHYELGVLNAVLHDGALMDTLGIW